MIRPLTGQVLVEVLPPEDRTDSGLFIPDIAQANARGEKAKPFKGRVVAIGPWRRTKSGLGVLPPFRPGATVLCNAYVGHKLTRNIGDRMILVSSDDVLAEITDAS